MNWLKAYNWTENYITCLPIGEWREISKLPVRNKEVFITCAKQYIDIYKDAVFSDDYTKIKRICKQLI